MNEPNSQNEKPKDELRLIAVEINGLLGRYIEIHDAIFKSSWRKIIPLPFIFKPIDFGRLQDITEKIQSQLETCKQQISELIEGLTQREKDFVDFLSQYCTTLIETVSLLRGILHQLHLKSQGSGKYSLTEYNKQCDLYKNAVDKYSAMGDQLNELYCKIG